METYIAHFEEASRNILLVSCADKLHNVPAILTDLQTDSYAVFDRLFISRIQTIRYYVMLAEVFTRRLPGPLARKLLRLLAEQC